MAARCLLAWSLVSSVAAVLSAPSAGGDFGVVVYGSTGGGVAAAIAASRSGVERVALVSADVHIGAMNTGGLQHADPANESTIGGIAAEIFARVEARYPSPHPPPPGPGPSSPQTYACTAGRCIPQASGGEGSSDPQCHGQCSPLAGDEWLAVRGLFSLSDSNMTLICKDNTYIKKTERLCHSGDFPASVCRSVTKGQAIKLARPVAVVDQTYYLIQVVSSPLRRLVQETTRSRLKSNLNDFDTSPHPGAPPGWLYAAHDMEEVMLQMLAEANVTIYHNVTGIASADRKMNTLYGITTVNGLTLTAKVFIDASYEGDLAFAAGASMTWGRESTAKYGEPDAGRRPPSIHYPISPYWSDGTVIPHVSDAPLVPVGEADDRVEVYDFRLCMTDSPSHMIPVQKPEGYNSSEWEFWRRLYDNGKNPPTSLKGAGLGCLGPIPNNYTDCGAQKCVKCDMLGMQHATDMLNGAWKYPNGTRMGRAAIREAHVRYTMGLLWFWATDPAAGEALHAELQTVGHCNDEYGPPQSFPSDPPHWPYQLYVREARRLVGDFVWTELAPPADIAARTTGLGSYTFDSHWVTLYANRSEPVGIFAEGRVNAVVNGDSRNAGVRQPPYAVPYDVYLPKRSELNNVLVPVACSASHVRFNGIRMEPVWMVMGHSTGTAAALAIADNSTVQDINVAELQRRLIAQNQKLVP